MRIKWSWIFKLKAFLNVSATRPVNLITLEQLDWCFNWFHLEWPCFLSSYDMRNVFITPYLTNLTFKAKVLWIMIHSIYIIITQKITCSFYILECTKHSWDNQKVREQRTVRREIQTNTLWLITFIKQPYIQADKRSFLMCVCVCFSLWMCFILPQLLSSGIDGASSLSPGLMVVAPWLDPVKRNCLMSPFVYVCENVPVSMSVNIFCYCIFSDSRGHTSIPVLAGPLCKQMALAGRFSEGWRLYLVASGKGVMGIADSVEEQFHFTWTQTHNMP